MKPLGKSGYRTLKAFHLFFVSVWSGSWMCLVLLLSLPPGNSGILQILDAERLIHETLVIPSVIGSLITGIIFSGATNWGFFKHRWVTIKYAFNIFPIIGGALIYLPRLREMIDLAQTDLSSVVLNPVFVSDRHVALLFLVLEFVFICGAVYLSVFKPRIGPENRV